MSKAKANSSTIVRALIEVSITPQKDVGFDSIAEAIYSYPEVKSCYLLSGGRVSHTAEDRSGRDQTVRFFNEERSRCCAPRLSGNIRTAAGASTGAQP